MSCFIVKEQCLFDVLTLIKNYKPELQGNKTDDEFIQYLYKMNRDAYQQRYREDIEDKIFKPFVKSERHELTLLKNLMAYLYQCSEGNIEETYSIYNELKNFQDTLICDFDQKYIMCSAMTHIRDPKKSCDALITYMKNKNIENHWGD